MFAEARRLYLQKQTPHFLPWQSRIMQINFLFREACASFKRKRGNKKLGEMKGFPLGIHTECNILIIRSGHLKLKRSLCVIFNFCVRSEKFGASWTQ